MRKHWFVVQAAVAAVFSFSALGQQGFTLEQVLSAPYALDLIAAPRGDLFAWVENAEGRRNLWVGGPHAAARSITHYTEDDGQDVSDPAWSPDASAVAYTYGASTGADGKPANPAILQRNAAVRVIVQPIAEGAAPIAVGEGHSPLFLRDGSAVLFVREGQIWRAGMRAEKAEQLVFDRGSASKLTLSPDGSLLAFLSTRREMGAPSHTFLALFDLNANTLRFAAPTTSNDLAPAFSPDGRELAWIKAPFTRGGAYLNPRTSANPWSIVVMDLASGVVRTVFTPEPNKPGSVLPHIVDSEPDLLFANEHRLIFYSEADGWTHLYEVDPTHADAAVLLTSGEFETEDASLTPGGEQLVFTSNEAPSERTKDADRMHLWRLDLRAGGLPIEITNGSGIETRAAFSSGTTAALIANAYSPMYPAYLDGAGHLRALHPGVWEPPYPHDSLQTPQQVIFDSTDGLKIHGQLFLPPHFDANKKHATLLFFHGGPNRQMLLGYPPMDYYSNAYAMNQYLASRGFIVLSVNYRGGTGYGLDFREAEHYGPRGASEYNDVLAAAKYLRSRADVDAARIGLWGGSYGGYLTALGLARNSDLFAAGVDFHGVHEWMLEDNHEAWLDGATGSLTTSAERDAIAATAHQSSPMADVDRWRSPVLLIHGDNDPEVAYAQTPVLAEALRARGVHVEEMILPNEVHGFLLHRDWVKAYEATARFFEQELKPEVVK